LNIVVLIQKAKMPFDIREKYVNIIRWLDHIQHLPQVSPLHTIPPNPPLPLLDLTPKPSCIFSFSFASLEVAQVARPKKEANNTNPNTNGTPKADGKETKVDASVTSATPVAVASTSGKKNQKEAVPPAAAAAAASDAKKERGKGGKEVKAAATVAPAASPAPAAEKKTKYMCNRLDIRVGRVVTAGAHPSDAAYVKAPPPLYTCSSYFNPLSRALSSLSVA
jgi:hypothetical protein